MKKIFTLISAAVLLAACNDLYGPTENPTPEVKSDGIDIEVKLVEDDAVTFTLTPKSEATFYSYLVDQSDVVEALDSASLFSVSYKGVEQGTIDWHLSKSKTLTVEGLAPNTPYVIYAVAGSSTGIPSSVASVTFTTSDKVAPKPARFGAKDNVVTLEFSEGIKLASGEVTVKYYAYNDPAFIQGTPVGTVSGTVTDVTGAVATIEFDIPDGAWYSVDVAAGAFEDYAGNASVGLNSSAKYNASDNEVVGRNIFGQRTLKSFDLGKYEAKVVSDWEAPILFDFGSEYGYGYTYSKKTGSTAVYSETGKTTAYDLTPGSDFGYVESLDQVLVYLPAEPERGSNVALTIAAGTFEDFYGNTNAEWSAEFLYAYDYTVEDVLGTYESQWRSVFDGKYYGGNDVIVASDNTEEGNVMFTSFCGIELESPVYATFTPESGEISIKPNQYAFDFSDEEGSVYNAFLVRAAIQGSSFVYSTTLPIVLLMPEIGKLENTAYFGFLGCVNETPATWYDGVYTYKASKIAAVGSAKTAAVPAHKNGFSLNAKVVK